jgi:hypothetical protein
MASSPKIMQDYITATSIIKSTVCIICATIPSIAMASSMSHADWNDQIYTIIPQIKGTHQRRQITQKENGETHYWAG